MSLFTFQLLCLGVLVVLSAIFSATEVAYTGLNFQQLRRLNKLFPGALSLWEKSPHKVLATLLLSNNAMATAAGVISAVMAGDLSAALGWPASILSLVFGFITGTAVLIFGEILPKVIAQRHSAAVALRITPFMRAWTKVVSPFARAAAWIANALLLGMARRAPRTPFLNKAALRRILIHARLPSVSHGLMNSLMDFGKLTAKDVARPRQDVFSLPLNMPLERVVQNVIQSGYSRVPVHNGNLDEIEGMLLTKDLLVAWRSGTLVVFQDLLRPVLTVGPGLPVPDLLRLFRSRRQHLAMVRNQVTGRVEGVVTLQNTLEALVGDIKEEN